MKKRIQLNAFSLMVALSLPANADEPRTSSQILHELHDFRETGSVLYIGAHPDDENNQFLAYLARGRGYRTAYLSLTRGEGGQNLIGPEQGEALGVLRTQELLAARRVDGAQQFFTSAIDFGFTKDYRDSFKFWDRKRVLGEIVRVIRIFRPDVIITRFSPEPSNTHGHHTASAMLALEAFKLAADRESYPEQLSALTPWQARRILWNAGGGPGSAITEKSNYIELETGGYDPLLGESYGEIGSRSRSMHRSQGMGRAGVRGNKPEYFKVLAGEAATRDLCEGIDTSWDRFPHGEGVRKLTDDIIAQFNPEDPAASVSALLKLQDLLAAVPPDSAVIYKSRQLNRILKSCLGLYVETVLTEGRVVPGETLKLKHTVIARAAHVIRWRGVRYPSVKRDVGEATELTVNQPSILEATQVLPQGSPLSQPYWLREKGTAGMYPVADPFRAGLPENPPVFPVEHIFEIEGRTLVIEDHAVQVVVEPAKGEARRSLEVVPPLSLTFDHELELFAPGSSHSVVVQAVAARANVDGILQLEAGIGGEGWKVKPATRAIHLAAAGARAEFIFTLTAPKKMGERTAPVKIAAIATVDGARYSRHLVEIRYDHIPPQLLQPPASFKAVVLNLAIRGRRVGYIPGAGDLIADCLRRMGYELTILGDADLNSERLRGLHAIVVGVRALNVRPDLDRRMSALFDYVKAGGNLILQYNTPDNLQTKHLAPYDLNLSNDRVTDPTAPVKLLVPKSPVFTYPNRITPADFEGWVQERGRNFPHEWNSSFKPLLAFDDPSGAPKNGSLLVAPFGRGYYVYTGLSLFRQLPEGVPGAFRLFANLLSLKK